MWGKIDKMKKEIYELIKDDTAIAGCVTCMAESVSRIFLVHIPHWIKNFSLGGS